MAVMRHLSDQRLSDVQRRYKDHHDCRVRAVTTFKAGQSFYIECPLMAHTAADRLASNAFSKLLPCLLGPNRIISATPGTILINGNGVPTLSLQIAPCSLLSHRMAHSGHTNQNPGQARPQSLQLASKPCKPRLIHLHHLLPRLTTQQTTSRPYTSVLSTISSAMLALDPALSTSYVGTATHPQITPSNHLHT